MMNLIQVKLLHLFKIFCNSQCICAMTFKHVLFCHIKNLSGFASSEALKASCRHDFDALYIESHCHASSTYAGLRMNRRDNNTIEPNHLPNRFSFHMRATDCFFLFQVDRATKFPLSQIVLRNMAIAGPLVSSHQFTHDQFLWETYFLLSTLKLHTKKEKKLITIQAHSALIRNLI